VVVAINDEGEADAQQRVVLQCDERTFKAICNCLESMETGDDAVVFGDAAVYPKSACVGSGLPKPVICEQWVCVAGEA